MPEVAREARRQLYEEIVDIVKAQRIEDSVFIFVPKPARKAVGGIESGDRLEALVERREGGKKSRVAYEKIDGGGRA